MTVSAYIENLQSRLRVKPKAGGKPLAKLLRQIAQRQPDKAKSTIEPRLRELWENSRGVDFDFEHEGTTKILESLCNIAGPKKIDWDDLAEQLENWDRGRRTMAAIYYTGEAPGEGRPPRAGTASHKRLGVRFVDDELDWYHAAAEKAGMSLSDVVRMLLSQWAPRDGGE